MIQAPSENLDTATTMTVRPVAIAPAALMGSERAARRPPMRRQCTTIPA